MFEAQVTICFQVRKAKPCTSTDLDLWNCIPPDSWLCKLIHHQMLVVAEHSNWSKEMPPDPRQSYWLVCSQLSPVKRKAVARRWIPSRAQERAFV